MRNISWLQYSEEMDVEKRLDALRRTFPVLRTDGDTIEYEQTNILAMSARVGSTALVEWLKVSGLSKFQIRELFNNRGPTESFAKEWGTSTLIEYLNAYSKRCGDSRLPFKIGWWDMAPLLELIDGDLDTWLPNASWVYLERRDKVAQAYSLWKATKHGIWHKRQGDSYKSPVTDAIPLDRIRERITLIEMENDCWKRFFDENKITPTCVFYEDFLAKPESTMSTVFKAFTGTEPPSDTQCPMMKISDDQDSKNVEYLKTKLASV